MLRRHAGHHGIVVNARIVDDDLNRAFAKDRLQNVLALLGVGYVEHHSTRGATERLDVGYDGGGAGDIAIGMNEHLHAACG